ncbi:uncharacterized protein YacL [Microbacterium sp. SORGH_AS 505]|uniref:hypothetical protein n=1 Tax=Microbacterium sp. SORGH_AS_0505 TaxID=3041770 RepID=UPI0027855371|nr:hypothetical protein [Microbacterium sp. SORGH_AS_0505]MDQ1127553.1 uncharacterized protein YacL [Microbacterium sp. SORGH_AS_0505]
MKIIRRVTLGLLLALGAVILYAGPAQALGLAVSAAQPETGIPGVVVTLDLPQLLNILLAVVFPVAVGFVTTRVTRPELKAVLLATISLVSGLVSSLLAAVLASIPFDIVGALLTGLAAWIIAVATHYGFWRPTGIANAVQGVGVTPKGD